jgi:hypothetical protein
MPAPSPAPSGRPADRQPTGVLIIRVWNEGSADRPELRARVVGRRDVEDEETETTPAASIDDILSAARRWLEAFVAGAP